MLSAVSQLSQADIVNALKSAFPEKIISLVNGEVTITTDPECLLNVLETMKKDFQFEQLIDVCGVDYLGNVHRFWVVYHLLSLSHNQRMRVKVPVLEGRSVPSAVSLFSSAGWWERETFDLFGISFCDHPDLRRILTDYDFEGYPLRKDFPLVGHLELRYDNDQRCIVRESVKLPQEYRFFDFSSPWEGSNAEVKKESV